MFSTSLASFGLSFLRKEWQAADRVLLTFVGLSKNVKKAISAYKSTRFKRADSCEWL